MRVVVVLSVGGDVTEGLAELTHRERINGAAVAEMTDGPLMTRAGGSGCAATHSLTHTRAATAHLDTRVVVGLVTVSAAQACGARAGRLHTWTRVLFAWSRCR